MNKHGFLAYIALPAATMAAGLLTALPAFAQQASFFDDFDSLSSQRWYVADGWATGTYQNCTWKSDQVKVEDGMLTVGFAPSPYKDRQYSCGALQTKQAIGYGTFEARLKTPSGSGLNAAFFSYIGPTQGKPHDEIDFEVLLRDTGKVQTTTFVNGISGDGEIGSGQDHDLPYPSDSDFINYAVTWTPETIQYFINGKLVRTIDEAFRIPTNPQRIFFSLWGSDTLTDWMGPFTPVTAPIRMEVDWVAYTALGETCQFPESVLCD
ncbi:Endo-1,3-1,4-beta-glycanase ExoK precursor [Devosia sp. LC5]|uniref:family 16 glycosylhydrolase n=1 Tax=Devosia sp. LC5 TaxID=1502724 RepID=UPI0004E43A95|nr:family 16 glycosylhydrolase [Devosia sp. LC5]KFC72258.1 Endo-1,3-1,4-beta-glycanase ExoK precursor [Devosia sp. LC5]